MEAVLPNGLITENQLHYVNKGKLYTMNADGSEQKVISGISDFEIFNISPDGNKIYFTRRVKLIRLQMKNIIFQKQKSGSSMI